MSKWIITAAWPYVNTVPHLGTMLQLLSGDVFTRYHKLLHHDVVYVSGSDSHGTPILVAAEKEGLSPKELAFKYHEIILKLLELWHIEFDNYSITENTTHISFVQSFYRKIYENDYMLLKESEQYFCEHCNRFLPDRFVEGTCPKCGAVGARGDQCTNPECGIVLKPTDLIDPYCATCKSTPILKPTKHWYFNLPAFSTDLESFIQSNSHIPSFAKQKVLSMIHEGLIERPITRDLSWGVPAGPIFGDEYKDKVLYVWTEAVVGYISAVKEWAEGQGRPELFSDFWLNPDTKTVFCIGKDNIIFHAILFPALLLATKDPYPLPYAIATTNFLMFKEGPFSKSKGIGVWADEALSILDADYWRFYLMINRPELRDSYFDWVEFERTVNTVLNDVIGNFLHRTIIFINQHFDGKIPHRDELGPEEEKVLSELELHIKNYQTAMNDFKIKDAVNIAVDVARLGNNYLSLRQPWHLIKEDKAKTGTVCNICAKIAETCCVLLWPIIPSVVERAWKALGFVDQIIQHGIEGLDVSNTFAEQKITKIPPLFKKIKAEQIRKQLNELRKKQKKEEKKMNEKKESATERISYEQFKQIDLRIATIKHAEPLEKSRNLIKLKIDLGTEERQILAGIKQYYKPEDLIGRQIVVIANLAPAKLMGEISDGMLLAADIDGEPILLNVDKPVPPGTKIR
ncbi:MAG: methionine--tRNA ligase [Candidatus Heimdallarchaeaceae archaeon]